MALKLVDIDDRLIHGQVATTWIPDFGIESAIIVSDKVANDPVQKSVAGLAAPDIKVSVFGVEKFIEVLKKTELKKATMVLFTNPIDALKLHENGLRLPERLRHALQRAASSPAQEHVRHRRGKGRLRGAHWPRRRLLDADHHARFQGARVRAPQELLSK